MYVALLYGVSASVLGLQSQEFVACCPSVTRLTNVGTSFGPDFQSALRFFEQSLIFATDRCQKGSISLSLFVHSTYFAQAGFETLLC